MGQNQGEGGFVPFVPGVLSVSEKKLDVKPEPHILGTQHPEPRDMGIFSPTIPRSTPAATDPNKPAEFRMTPRPLTRLLENLKAVHIQLEQDQAHGFILETFDLGVPSKLTVRGIQWQALERAVKQAQERTPDAERVVMWTVQPDGWEVMCSQYHDAQTSKRPVMA
jgi:hypothetical protein